MPKPFARRNPSVTTELCQRCGRTHVTALTGERPWCGSYVTVKHDFYGCETGCCGHTIYLYDMHNHVVAQKFVFIHPWADSLEDFCRSLAQRHFPDIPIRLEQCEILDD